jgi:hypothetical protein
MKMLPNNRIRIPPLNYGGTRQWAVEKLPKAIHFHNQTRGYANGLICQKNKEEYSSRRPQGFPVYGG